MDTMYTTDLWNIMPIIVGISIGFFIHYKRHKKTGEPEYDERTEKVAGKAAQCTIIVLMAAMALIMWGAFFDLFTLGSNEVVSLLFFTLLFSMIGFRHYYLSKEL
jgi:uncharacterized membrane protein